MQVLFLPCPAGTAAERPGAGAGLPAAHDTTTGGGELPPRGCGADFTACVPWTSALCLDPFPAAARAEAGEPLPDPAAEKAFISGELSSEIAHLLETFRLLSGQPATTRPAAPADPAERGHARAAGAADPAAALQPAAIGSGLALAQLLLSEAEQLLVEAISGLTLVEDAAPLVRRAIIAQHHRAQRVKAEAAADHARAVLESIVVGPSGTSPAAGDGSGADQAVSAAAAPHDAVPVRSGGGAGQESPASMLAELLGQGDDNLLAFLRAAYSRLHTACCDDVSKLDSDASTSLQMLLAVLQTGASAGVALVKARLAEARSRVEAEVERRERGLRVFQSGHELAALSKSRLQATRDLSPSPLLRAAAT